MNWIQTATGGMFWPTAPETRHVNVEDIAHALGNLCRFNGHSKRFYSVAEHSLYVARVALQLCDAGECGFTHEAEKPMIVRQALLHDAAEAYIGDWPAPIKTELGIIQVENKILWHVREALLGPTYRKKYDGLVSIADRIMLATEKRDLMKTEPASWHALPNPAGFCILYPEESALQFGPAWLKAWHNVDEFVRNGGKWYE